MASDDVIAQLRPAERERLDRFARAFDLIDATHYIQLAESVDDDARAAQEHALEILGNGRRRDLVRSAVMVFVDAAMRAYSARLTVQQGLLVGQSVTDRAEDRVRFVATVERAVVGLILWDELDEDDRAALIGPWGSFLEEPAP